MCLSQKKSMVAGDAQRDEFTQRRPSPPNKYSNTIPSTLLKTGGSPSPSVQNHDTLAWHTSLLRPLTCSQALSALGPYLAFCSS